MWGNSGGVTKEGIFLHPFSKVKTCRQCVWSREWKRWPHRWPHKSISQPSAGTCNKSLVSPRPRFVSTVSRGREHGRVYGMENQSSTCQVTPPSPSFLSFPDSHPLDEHPIVALNLPLQIYRPNALKRHPLVTYKDAIYKRNKLCTPMGLVSFRCTEMKHVGATYGWI